MNCPSGVFEFVQSTNGNGTNRTDGERTLSRHYLGELKSSVFLILLLTELEILSRRVLQRCRTYGALKLLQPLQRVLPYSFWQNVDSLAKMYISDFCFKFVFQPKEAQSLVNRSIFTPSRMPTSATIVFWWFVQQMQGFAANKVTPSFRVVEFVL